MFSDKNFTIVDVETTGGQPWKFSRIIEIGLLKIERGEVAETFQALLNPQTEIPKYISKMTGISNKMVEVAPLFEEIAQDLLPKFENSIFVAHNVNFDYSFLKAEFWRSGLGFNLPKLCSVKMSRAFFPQHKKHSLSEIIARNNFVCENRHRALDDAKIVWELMQSISQNFDHALGKAKVNKLISQPRVNNFLAQQSFVEKIIEYED